MKGKKQVWKLLSVIPYTIVLSLTEIVRPTLSDEPLPSILWHSLFGRVSAGDIKTFTLALDSLGCIFLFALLFGDFIASYFGETSIFIFTRVNNRAFWASKKVGMIAGYAAFFALAAVLIKGYTSALRKEAVQFSSELFLTFFAAFILLFLLIIQIGIFSNFMSTQYGNTVGVFSALGILITLALLSVLFFENRYNQIFNPLCFNAALLDQTSLLYGKIMVSVIYLLAITTAYIKHIHTMDIYGK